MSYIKFWLKVYLNQIQLEKPYDTNFTIHQWCPTELLKALFTEGVSGSLVTKLMMTLELASILGINTDSTRQDLLDFNFSTDLQHQTLLSISIFKIRRCVCTGSWLKNKKLWWNRRWKGRWETKRMRKPDELLLQNENLPGKFGFAINMNREAIRCF